MLKFRRITECEDEAAYMQKRFKQDICPQEKRFTAIPSVVLKSDFSSLNASYLNLPTPGGIQKKADELVSKTDNVKADSVPIVQTPSGFEEMNINEIGTDSYDIYRDIIKHSLTLPSEPGLDEAIRLVHTIGPEETIGAELWAKEPFSPIISPTELLKCVLNVLQGEESFLFRFDKELKIFRVSLVKITFHSTQSTVEFLREFGSVGAKMRRMRDFTKHYILPFDTHQQARQTPTLMAFSQSLDRVLLSLKKKVMKIPRRVLEARASRRGEVILESQLYTTYISPLELLSVARLEVFPEVCTLYEFYAFAVEHNRGTPVPTSAQILSQMYCFLRDSRQAPNYRDLLAIFMASIKPFHSVLDSFLACGEALDPCNEFFVEKSTFFDRGESYVPVFITKYAKQIKEIGFMFNLLGLGHGNNCVLAPASTTVESTISSIPECEHDTSMDCEPTPNSLLLRKQRSIDDVIRESQNDIGVTFRSAACSIEYTTNAMNEKPTKCFASNESEDNADEMLNETDIKRLVDAMFCASVEGSYTRTGAAAVAAMDREWHMRRHINAVKNYLLMEAGDFSSALCERIFRIHSEFADYQCMLDETCRECFWEDECRKNLSFTVADTERHPLDSIKYLDFLSLTYSVGNGKDPITHVLFTRENMKKYEMMWKFLLRIKRALFLLKEAWVSTKRVVPRDLATVGTVPPESEARKARIAMGFMDRLLKDVEVYFYQEALCAPWGVFSSSLDSASNIEDLTRCHSAFVDEMLARCFITKKYAPIARMFTTLIDTAIKFTYAYEEGELRWKPLDDKFSETARTLYEVLSKVSEGKTRYDLSLAQLLHVLGLVGWKPH